MAAKPPIRDLDEPLDNSDDDKVERFKKKEVIPDNVRMALEVQSLGFDLMPLPTHEKSPPPKDWPATVAKFRDHPAVWLRNPGTQNYAILCPPGVVGLDIDGTAPDLMKRLTDELGPLPATRVHMTPNGWHWFYHWPTSLPRPKGAWWGSVVARWGLGDGQGYLVGPGSQVKQDDGSVKAYGIGFDDDIAVLPLKWAESVLSFRPPREVKQHDTLVEVHQGYELPFSVGEGGRYEAIRNFVASKYNRGLSKNEVWEQLLEQLVPRFDVALTDAELRDRFDRTVSNIRERLGPPAAHMDTPEVQEDLHYEQPETESTGEDGSTPRPLFTPASEFVAQMDGMEPEQWLVNGWIPAAGLTWWAGQPKSMKSLAILQMLGEFCAGGSWMGRDIDLDGQRVALYLTKEGSRYDTTERIRRIVSQHGAALGNRLRISYLDTLDFDPASFTRISAFLAEVESEFSALPGQLNCILVIDPMRDFMLAGWDENDAKALAQVKRWCRTLASDFPWLSIIVVHHLRKSAGMDGGSGLDMAGSGAGYAAGDGTILWSAKRDAKDEDDDDGGVGGPLVEVVPIRGGYKVEPRGEAKFKGSWDFDPVAMRFERGVGVATVRTASGGERAAPAERSRDILATLRRYHHIGATASELAEDTGVAKGNVHNTLKRSPDAVQEGGRWYAAGWQPSVQEDVILPPSLDDIIRGD